MQNAYSNVFIIDFNAMGIAVVPKKGFRPWLPPNHTHFPHVRIL